jgi:hypothetical protein
VDAWLKGSGTIPWHFRDEKTHAPLDWNEYPNATMYSPNGADPYIKNPPSPITLDTAHEGSFAYVPFVLTGNPYALEEMQFYCTYNVVMLPPSARNKFNLGNAVRAVAWTLRALAHCATVTPLDVPSWLKPRSFFKDYLDAERDWFMTYVNNPAAPHSGLHLLGGSNGSASAGTGFPANTWTSIWMEDFLTAVIGWIVCMGHEDWRPILEWKAQDVIARTNGTSGWIRACPTMYQLSLNDPNKPMLNNWGDVWVQNVKVQPEKCQYINKDVLSLNAYYTYSSYALGALAMCARAGISAAQEPYDWLLSELQKGDIAARNIKRKWAVASPDHV